jgi:hypothetical protein
MLAYGMIGEGSSSILSDHISDVEYDIVLGSIYEWLVTTICTRLCILARTKLQFL